MSTYTICCLVIFYSLSIASRSYAMDFGEFTTEQPTFNQENFDNSMIVHTLALGATEEQLNQLEKLQMERVLALRQLIRTFGVEIPIALTTQLAEDVILLRAWHRCAPFCDRDRVARQTLVIHAIDSDDKVGILKVLINRYTINQLVASNAILFDPLRHAIDKNRVRVVQLLFEHGAQAHVNRVDSLGQTALDVAQNAQRGEICEILRSNGALTAQELIAQQEKQKASKQ